ncbi:MAG: nucleoside deaminase [Trueperaceae bacterium]|nr:MAG: nucleoside deaminase [Trueperaceae bacterium]
MNHTKFLRVALKEATLALEEGGPPIAALIVDPQGRIVATGKNRVASVNDPTAHAEVEVIRNAGPYLLEHATQERLTLYTTAEPCLMCLGAIVKANIASVVWALSSSLGSATDLLAESGHLSNHWQRLSLLGEPDAAIVQEMRALRASG